MATDSMTPSIADRLKIQVNPEFDHEAEPEDQPVAYVNPVRLNNDLIRLSNQLVLFAEERARLIGRRTKLRHQRRSIETARESRERVLLRDTPLSPAEAKSLKTIEAAVARRAQLSGEEAQFAAWDAELGTIEAELDKIEAAMDVYSVYAHTTERMTDNIKSHLSYVKAERQEALRAR